MEGGFLWLSQRVKALSFDIPLAWWVPQKERALLAIVGAIFWIFTILQALQKDASGASVFAFFGLGLLYTMCVMANLADAVRASLARQDRSVGGTEASRALVQLFGIMTVMLVCNSLVMIIYLAKGAALTTMDVACLLIAGVALALLMYQHGLRGMLRHPIARGFLSVACKALPQTLLAGLFLLQPQVAGAFTFWSLGSLAMLSMLRFWPSIRAYKREPKSRPMQGVMISETSNLASILLLCATWLFSNFAFWGA